MTEATNHRTRTARDQRRRPGRGVAGRALALGCATLAALVGVAAPAAAAGGDGTSLLQRDTDAVHQAGAVGATAVLTTADGVTTAHAGTADLATGAPARPDAHFRAGSTTKPFVATVVLQLVGEGRLSLDDPVETWLPGVVAGNGHDGSRITVRQLLQHTSGLPDYVASQETLPVFHSADGYREHRLRHYTDEELVAAALRQPAEFEPGTDWSYSNTNYVLAGMIIERVTDHSWRQEVRERIIEPLGLTGTELPGDRPTLPEPFLRGYHGFREGDPLVDTTLFNPTAASAAGELISTPRDIDRFLSALLGGELLRPAQLAEMRTVHPIPGMPGLGYGLGLFRTELSCGGAYWGHGGSVLGYYSDNGVTADGSRAVAVATNSLSADAAVDEAKEAAMLRLIDDALCDR